MKTNKPISMTNKKKEMNEQNVKRCAYSCFEDASKRPISINDMEGMYWCEMAYRMGDVFFSKGAVAVSASNASELLCDPSVEVIDNLYKREIRNSDGAKEVKTICAFKDKDTFERAISAIDNRDACFIEKEQALVLSDEAADNEEMKKKREKAACLVASIIATNNQERGMSDLTARQALLLKRCAEIFRDFPEDSREGHLKGECEFMLETGGIITCNEYRK